MDSLNLRHVPVTDPSTGITSPASSSTAAKEESEAASNPKTPPTTDPSHRSQETGEQEIQSTSFWLSWYRAFKQILPTYIAVHMAFFVTTCLAALFTVRDFAWGNVPIYWLWQSWHHWDTGHYMAIATYGYTEPAKAAFFPLFPLLERALMFITHNALTAGLLISNVAGLLMLMMLYQLVLKDFDHERALRTVLYISVFPTAFFFASAYNESLFLCLVLLSFYNQRHGNWWLAGLFGFFASLTRSAGVLLLLPFCYEYLRQHEFNLRRLRLNIVSAGLIPAGMGLFAIYCYFQFHDLLAFSHAQSSWQHYTAWPWHGIGASIMSIKHSSGFLSFQALRNLTDLLPDLLMLLIIILSVVGPWRMPRTHLSYVIYAAVLYIFLNSFPVAGTGLFPLQSVSRYVLEIFPAFIILAGFGKARMFHMNYVMICGAILFFLLTQFLTGHWVL